MSGLTTHILDLTSGRPAADVVVRLLVRSGGDWRALGPSRTDADGRSQLLTGDELTAGGYRLEFDIGPYFRRTGASSADPGFLETVVVDFSVADPGPHHHIPLLVSLFGYSTYRGS